MARKNQGLCLVALLTIAATSQLWANNAIWVGVETSVSVAVKDTTLAAPTEAESLGKMQSPLIIKAVNPKSIDAATGAQTYEIRIIGLQKGEHDLRDWLKLPEGVNRQMISPIVVRVSDPLPPDHGGQLETPPVLAREAHAPGLRARTVGLIGTAWAAGVAGLCAAWWIRSHPRRVKVPAGPVEDPLPRMLRLAELKMLTPQSRADIERELLDRWRRELNIAGAQGVNLIRAIEKDPRGQALLMALEDWQRCLETGPAPLPALLKKYAKTHVNI